MLYKIFLLIFLLNFFYIVRADLSYFECNKTAECAEECGKIRYCNSNGTLSETVKCPASHPYCAKGRDSDHCSTAPDLNRYECQHNWPRLNEIFCTSEGYFPGKKYFNPLSTENKNG